SASSYKPVAKCSKSSVLSQRPRGLLKRLTLGAMCSLGLTKFLRSAGIGLSLRLGELVME
ncbi:MAG: hypothetical protein QW288_05090, partial [Ignisphaera sp.]